MSSTTAAGAYFVKKAIQSGVWASPTFWTAVAIGAAGYGIYRLVKS